jgi:hypothetical protein
MGIWIDTWPVEANGPPSPISLYNGDGIGRFLSTGMVA